METEFIWQAGRNFQRMSAFLLSSGKVIKMRILEREKRKRFQSEKEK